MRKKQREEGGETMAEEKKNQPVSTAQTTQPVSTAQTQSVSSEQTAQPVGSAQSVEKPVVDKNTLVEAFIEAQQKLIELEKKQREEEGEARVEEKKTPEITTTQAQGQSQKVITKNLLN